MLKAKALQDFKTDPVANLLGTPQERVVSPLLSNIVLHELDIFMVNYMKTFNKGKCNISSKDHQRLYCKEGIQSARKVNRLDPFYSNYKRITYVRHADDFIVGIRGSRQDALLVRKNIATFFLEHLKLELSMDKTYITNLNKSRIYFLGYVISKSAKTVHYRKRVGTSAKSIKVFSGGRIRLDVDHVKVIKNLSQKKFCTNLGYPLPNFNYLAWPQKNTVFGINTILIELANYYHLANNKRQLIMRFSYILRFSLAKLFAAKFRLHSVPKVFAVAGKALAKPIKSKFPAIGLTDEKLES